MRHLRAWLRLLGLGAVSLICALCWWLARVFTKNGSERQIRAHTRWVRRWSRWTFRAIGVHMSCEGPPPKRPAVLVSNHLSYLDVLALWHFADGLFISKASVAQWPFFGPLSRLGGTLFIDRKKKSDLKRVRDLACERIAEGNGVVFFPEGTSTPGYEILPFKPGLFALVLDSGAPVHVASISYTTPEGAPPAADAVCWWGDMEFFPHLYSMLQIPRIEGRVRFHAEPADGTDRKSMALSAHARCMEVFERVQGARPFDWQGPDNR